MSALETAAPVAGDDRIHALDILRGFALWGMIVVHFHQRVHTEAAGFEDLIGWVTWVGIEAKSWAAFAFLFGVGFAMLDAPVWSRARFRRRRSTSGASSSLVSSESWRKRRSASTCSSDTRSGVCRCFSCIACARAAVLLVAVVAASANPVIRAGTALHWWPPMVTPASARAGAELWAAVRRRVVKGASCICCPHVSS